MEEMIYKVREDLVITPSSEGRRTYYSVFNPASGETLRLNQNVYLVLRHFNGKRTPLEMKRHLEEKHSLTLRPKALENYLDLFLDAYLFDRDCLELYWERLGKSQQEFLGGELKICARDFNCSSEIPFVESLVLNQALKALDSGDIPGTIKYLKDAGKINPENQYVSSFLARIEKGITSSKTQKIDHIILERFSALGKELNKPSLRYALATAVILFMLVAWRGNFISGTVNPGISLGINRENSLRVIKTVSEQLIEDKSLALTRSKFL